MGGFLGNTPFGQQTVPTGGFGYTQKYVNKLQSLYDQLSQEYDHIADERNNFAISALAWKEVVTSLADKFQLSYEELNDAFEKQQEVIKRDFYK